MNRRAANALRLLAVFYILTTIKTVVVGVLRDTAFAKLRDGHDAAIDSHAVIDRLQLIGKISWVSHVGLVVACLVCVVVLAMSLERGRALAHTAVVLLLASLGFYIYQQLRPSLDPGAGTKAMWIVSGAIYVTAGVLPLLAAVRAVPGWKHAGLVVGGGITLIVLPTALDAFMMLSDTYSTAWEWIFRGVDIVNTGWFVAFGLVIARMLQRNELPVPADAGSGPALDGGPLDGGPLRAIGWAILVRVGVGVLAAIASVIGTMHNSYDTLGAVAIGSTVIGVITTLFLIGGLSGYAKFPAMHRSDGLYIVIGLLVVGVILDIVGAKTTSTLFDLVAKAQHADSMWSMPSISDIESMQATAVWTSRLSLVVGLVSVLLLLGSLTTTARSANAHALAGTSSVTMGLVVIAATGAIAIGAWMQHVKHDDEGTLLAFAIVLLIVATAALINLLRVLFGIARAVETSRAEPQQLDSDKPAH
jgi:hypothetical protein